MVQEEMVDSDDFVVEDDEDDEDEDYIREDVDEKNGSSFKINTFWGFLKFFHFIKTEVYKVP